MPIGIFDEVRLARAANQTLLVWSQNGRMYGVVLDEHGVPPETLIEFRDGFHPVVVARGDEWVIAWVGRNGIESVRMSRDREISTLQEFGGTAQQYTPAIAATASGYLVAWHEIEEGIDRLVVEPLDAQARRTVGGNRIVERRGSLSNPAVGCGPTTCLVTWDGGVGEMWSTLVRHDGTKISADRVFRSSGRLRRPIIEALPDGSFVIYRSGEITPVSATSEPGITQVWATQPLGLANMLAWRGHRTAIYTRAADGAGRLFAFELTSRSRSVRH